MYFDAHIHSAVSPDSQMDVKVAIDTLRRQGLGATFTEHCDFPPYNFMVDFARYESEYRPLRSDSVLMGLELTLNEQHMALNTQTAAGDWDFILGAVHYVDGLDLYHNANTVPAPQLTRRYLTYAKELVESCGFFDALAHIDYICRYSKGVDACLQYDNYPDEFDALLTAIAQRVLAMEINSSRLDNARNRQVLFKIYQRYAALGGKYVTIGSDAHAAPQLGRNFNHARAIVDEAGLTAVYFRERKMYGCAN